MTRRSSIIVLALGVTLAAGVTFAILRSPPTGREIRNVVLISIDTCRADRFGCYTSSLLGATPNIDALAKEGAIFTRAQSTNALTLPSHSSMLTGTTPLQHRVHDNNNFHLSPESNTLAEILGSHGLKTAAVVAAIVLDGATGLSQGFDSYDDEMPNDGSPRPGWNLNERQGDAITQRANAWLDANHNERFFLFLHYFDPHQAYLPPEPFKSRFLSDPYTGEVAFTDACIGQVIKKLKSLGIYDDTLIIITSDHAESFGEHNEYTHSFFAYQTTIGVPLVVRVPPLGSQSPDSSNTVTEISTPVSVIDIAPTILDLLGVPQPEGIEGTSLSSLLASPQTPGDNRYLYCESTFPTRYGCSAIRALTHGDWKYLHNTNPELYNLKDDAAETKNVLDDHPEIVARMERRLRDMFDRRRQHVESSEDTDAEKLQSLGYIGGADVAAADSFDGKPGAEDPKTFVRYHSLISAAQGAFGQEDYEDARLKCLEVLASRPNVPDAHSTLGMTFRAQGRHADAVAHLTKYLALVSSAEDDTSQEFHRSDSKIADIRIQLGKSLLALKQGEEAIQSFRQALAIQPESIPALRNLAMALRSQDQAEQAVPLLRKALEQQPQNAQIHFDLGMVFHTLGEHDKAASAYRKSIELEPERDGAIRSGKDTGRARQTRTGP